MRIGLYTATKHALVGYGEMLRMELEPENIGVSVLCPSGVVGNLAATSARDRFQRLGQSTPEGRGEPPNPRNRMPNEMVGPLVVRAIKANRFFILNRPESIATAFEERHLRLREDAEFYRADFGSK
jgi:short-subunit dehydrogenase